MKAFVVVGTLIATCIWVVAACGDPAPPPELPADTPVTVSSYDEITVWRDPGGCEYLVVKQAGKVVALTPRLASASNGMCKS